MPGATFNTRKNIESCDSELDRAVLYSILSAQGDVDFKHTCSTCPILFGQPNSTRRKNACNRRYRLLKLRKENPKQFMRRCTAAGLSLKSRFDSESIVISETSPLQLDSSRLIVESSSLDFKMSTDFSPSTFGTYIMECFNLSIISTYF
jgi:hypothetical protein